MQLPQALHKGDQASNWSNHWRVARLLLSVAIDIRRSGNRALGCASRGALPRDMTLAPFPLIPATVHAKLGLVIVVGVGDIAFPLWVEIPPAGLVDAAEQ